MITIVCVLTLLVQSCDGFHFGILKKITCETKYSLTGKQLISLNYQFQFFHFKYSFKSNFIYIKLHKSVMSTYLIKMGMDFRLSNGSRRIRWINWVLKYLREENKNSKLTFTRDIRIKCIHCDLILLIPMSI